MAITSRYENIELVQLISEYLGREMGFDDEALHWIGMAVREGVANAIKHGNRQDAAKRVQVDFECGGGEIVVRIEDEGRGFTLATVPDPVNPENLMRTSGRGIFYIKTFMDEVDYEVNPDRGTTLVMRKRLKSNP